MDSFEELKNVLSLLISYSGEMISTSCSKMCCCYADLPPALLVPEVKTEHHLVALRPPHFQYLAALADQVKYCSLVEDDKAIRTCVCIQVEAGGVWLEEESEMDILLYRL